VSTPTTKEDSTAGFCLTIPGKTLYLTPLLAMKTRGTKMEQYWLLNSWNRKAWVKLLLLKEAKELPV